MTVATYFEGHLHATSSPHATSGCFHTKNALEHAGELCNRRHACADNNCSPFCSFTLVNTVSGSSVNSQKMARAEITLDTLA